MKIEIMGVGCPKCRRTTDLIAEAVRKAGIEAEVVHVTDLKEIVDRDVMMTPAVFVDGRKVIEGRIPTESQIKSWLAK